MNTHRRQLRPRIDVSGTQQVPFSRLVTVEMRKMGDTRAGLWLLIAIVAITAARHRAVLVFAPERRPQDFEASSGPQPPRRGSCSRCSGSCWSPASGGSAQR